MSDDPEYTTRHVSYGQTLPKRGLPEKRAVNDKVGHAHCPRRRATGDTAREPDSRRKPDACIQRLLWLVARMHKR
jgi:hypothetical protein